jgi:hypothetical protein
MWIRDGHEWRRARRLAVALAAALVACSGSEEDTSPSREAAGGAAGEGGGGSTGTSMATGGGQLGADECRTTADCELGSYCVAAGGTAYCPECDGYEPEVCSVDDDCQATDPLGYCDPDPCHCDSPTKCYSGCAGDADCNAHEICDDTHRCAPKPCAADADCPGDFACSTDGAGCVRRTCDNDAECSGYCVTGECHGDPGTCSMGLD